MRLLPIEFFVMCSVIACGLLFFAEANPFKVVLLMLVGFAITCVMHQINISRGVVKP